MTPLLISLEYAQAHLKLDNTAGDADLTGKIRAASRAILNHIKNGADPFTDSAGEAIPDSNGVAIDIPEDIQEACAMLVGYFDRNRSSDEANAFADGWLPGPVVSLLVPYRVPSLS